MNKRRSAVLSHAALLAASAIIIGPTLGRAASFTFDEPPLPFQNTYTTTNPPTPQNATATATRTTQAPVWSGAFALKLSGNDTLAQAPSYAYMKLFSTDILVTTTTTLSYQLYPMNDNGAYVAVDLIFDDGSALRGAMIMASNNAPLHPTHQHPKLRVGEWNAVSAVIGPSFAGRRIREVLIAYDGPSAIGAFDARLDHVGITDSKIVSIEGDIVQGSDATAPEQPFAHEFAIIDPYGVGSTCGPTIAQQSVSSLACRSMSHYVAQARVYTKGYVKVVARVPRDLDVVVSVCTGTEATFGCRDHPADSYCRPKQSSSGAKTYIWMPPTPPPFIDVRWKYVPEALNDPYIACEKKGPYQAKVFSEEMNVDPRLGDVDGNRVVTVSDGVQALRCAAELANCDNNRADIDCKEGVTVSDGVNILRLAAELPIKAGCDRDGDGLLDEWEQFGYDDNGDGTPEVRLNEAPFNANVFRKDLFVECDFMVTSDHTHKLSDLAISDVAVVFAAAPVSNPGTSNGIVLHVDTGALGGGAALPHQGARLSMDDVARIRDGDSTHPPALSPPRRSIFHYCVLSHSDTGLGGQARVGEPFQTGGDVLKLEDNTANANNAITFRSHMAHFLLHEMGHNLGLDHGGQDEVEQKPNYLSAMNSFFAEKGILARNGSLAMDFARFDVHPLNESALNEIQGLEAGTNEFRLADFGTQWVVGNTVKDTTHAGFSIDWSGNGPATDINVQADINGDGFIGSCNNPNDPRACLTAASDWDKLTFTGGLVGDIGTAAMIAEHAATAEPVVTNCEFQ